MYGPNVTIADFKLATSPFPKFAAEEKMLVDFSACSILIKVFASSSEDSIISLTFP